MSIVLREMTFPSGHRLQVAQGDLTAEAVDAIVNAANQYLQHGGGLAGAIVRRGGSQIQAESEAWVRQHGPVTHAEPAYTGPGRLPCRYIIHAVGPVWGEGDEENKLSAAVAGALWRADQLKLTSLALPAISTGIFGFPKARAAEVIFAALEGYFSDHPESGVGLVRLVLFDQETLQAFLKTWDTRWTG